ncbi:PREDICTED: beta-glucosidase [Prunus dulcis]|nr:lysosomal beta glucosidase-like isoform X2 [Prunus dulcis]VVA36031.1 PREDICTED: beta-glucosidase [Prunus dulcis]
MIIKTNSFVLLVGLVCLCCCAEGTKIKVKAHHMKYKNPKEKINVRVEDLLAQMTLKEKLGQMAQVDRGNITAKVMKEYNIGSVLSGGESVPRTQATPRDWIDMINKFQNWSLASRLGIPMIYGIDAVHGHNNVYKATMFPHNVGLGATRDPELVKRIGAATALEVRATGIQYSFAPCVSVCRDPRWGRCYESFSEDPNIVKQMTDFVIGLQGEIPAGSPKGVPYVGGTDKVAGSAKHYVGDGGTTKGINENDTVIDWQGLLNIHMPGYPEAIAKGVATVMVSYSSWNGVKMHANYDLVTKYLKDTLKFKGIVISDWLGVDKISNPPFTNYSNSVLLSIQAGLDMIMLPYNYIDFVKFLTEHVNNKRIPMSRIDDAVRRILSVKFMMGLFEKPMSSYEYIPRLGCQEHRDLGREAVRKSLVLLKNGKTPTAPLLPLPKKANRILVAGTHANNLGYQCGGWSLTWQGVSGNNHTVGTTILGAIASAVNETTEIVFSLNPDTNFVKANKFDYAVVAVGELPYAETKGDSVNLTIAEPGPSIITNVCGAVKCAVIVVSGRPVVIEPYLSSMDALVAAWLPGTEGQGVADVLYGDYGFTGKLPRTWFRRVDQLPMNFGEKNYDPLFPFGFGLTTQPVNNGVKPSQAN